MAMLETVMAGGSPAGGTSPELDEAHDMVSSLRAQLAQSRRGLTLAEPACASGCTPCFRACAVFRIMLGWWERELHRLLAERGTVLRHSGRSYAEDAGSC